jgi:hypothetical protein
VNAPSSVTGSALGEQFLQAVEKLEALGFRTDRESLFLALHIQGREALRCAWSNRRRYFFRNLLRSTCLHLTSVEERKRVAGQDDLRPAYEKDKLALYSAPS